jgi:hypothetical protein
MTTEEYSPGNGSPKQLSVNIWLDSYDDVFSDFDSRAFSERSLSDDFIVEARKMAKEKPAGRIELILQMPAAKRDQQTEATIIKNLHTHFRRVVAVIESEVRQSKRRGFILSSLGFLLMIASAYLISISSTNFSFHVLRVILEPSGWFMVWSGLEDLFYGSRKKKAELEFNLKMAHADIRFVSLSIT